MVERDREGLKRGQPYRFFRLTAAARELFDRNNLCDPDAYRELFAEVDKSDEIEGAEAVERPDGDPLIDIGTGARRDPTPQTALETALANAYLQDIEKLAADLLSNCGYDVEPTGTAGADGRR